MPTHTSVLTLDKEKQIERETERETDWKTQIIHRKLQKSNILGCQTWLYRPIDLQPGISGWERKQMRENRKSCNVSEQATYRGSCGPCPRSTLLSGNHQAQNREEWSVEELLSIKNPRKQRENTRWETGGGKTLLKRSSLMVSVGI